MGDGFQLFLRQLAANDMECPEFLEGGQVEKSTAWVVLSQDSREGFVNGRTRIGRILARTGGNLIVRAPVPSPLSPTWDG